MDQAAPAHQGLLRHQRECRENPNLDRCLGLRAGGHRAKTARHRSCSLSNPTLFEKTPISQALQQIDSQDDLPCPVNQLNLFNL